MVGRREARKYAQAEADLDKVAAAVQVQRIIRGKRQDYHYPQVRAPADDSFDEESSEDNAEDTFGF